jgi:Zn-finger nucleic acid-binding protein
MTKRNCPHCAKPTSTQAAKCAHCGRSLPADEDRPVHLAITCPRCAAATDAVTLAAIELDICRSCRGLWFDRAELRSFGTAVSDDTMNAQITELLRELGSRVSRPAGSATYIACPVCSHQLSRTNYASISGIILHSCRHHGTWADHEAAVRLVELMAEGGEARLEELVARNNQRRLERIESTQVSHAARLSELDMRSRIHIILDALDFL